MSNTLADSHRLAPAQTDPPPPADEAEEPLPARTSLLLELQTLADRAGGLDRLRDLVDALRRSQR